MKFYLLCLLVIFVMSLEFEDDDDYPEVLPTTFFTGKQAMDFFCNIRKWFPDAMEYAKYIFSSAGFLQDSTYEADDIFFQSFVETACEYYYNENTEKDEKKNIEWLFYIPSNMDLFYQNEEMYLTIRKEINYKVEEYDSDLDPTQVKHLSEIDYLMFDTTTSEWSCINGCGEWNPHYIKCYNDGFDKHEWIWRCFFNDDSRLFSYVRVFLDYAKKPHYIKNYPEIDKNDFNATIMFSVRLSIDPLDHTSRMLTYRDLKSLKYTRSNVIYQMKTEDATYSRDTIMKVMVFTSLFLGVVTVGGLFLYAKWLDEEKVRRKMRAIPNKSPSKSPRRRKSQTPTKKLKSPTGSSGKRKKSRRTSRSPKKEIFL